MKLLDVVAFEGLEVPSEEAGLGHCAEARVSSAALNLRFNMAHERYDPTLSVGHPDLYEPGSRLTCYTAASFILFCEQRS